MWSTHLPIFRWDSREIDIDSLHVEGFTVPPREIIFEQLVLKGEVREVGVEDVVASSSLDLDSSDTIGKSH